MTTTAPARSTRVTASGAEAASPGTSSSARDRSIDLIRAGCLIVVVGLHAMMVGVTLTPAGPVFENALDTDWFAPVSWLVQMMPLFFIAGGFTGLTSWRRARTRGVSAAAFVAGRLQRLLLPAIVTMGAVAIGLLLLLAGGVPADIVQVAGFRISQPLWFLGVFLLCQAFVPLLVRAHERRPLATLITLGGGIVVVDALRLATGIEGVGFLNLAVLWLFVQQLGFWLADARLDELSRRSRWMLAGGLFATLVALTTVGPYSPDMYVNLNPPTIALGLLALLQLLLFSLAQPMLRSWAEHRLVARAADAIGARSMTVYLWHMPTMIALAGATALIAYESGTGLPALGSSGWWATRPVWLLVVFVAVGLVTALTARFERRSTTLLADGIGRIAAASVVAVASVAVLFVLGLSVPIAILSVFLMAVSLRLAARPAGMPGDAQKSYRGRTTAGPGADAPLRAVAYRA